MKRSILEQSRSLMRRRKFGIAVRLLESYSANYRGSFEYYLCLGTSCLYLDDEGNAAKYYQAARNIHTNSSELLLGQAAIFLRHGNNAKALQYYLDVLDMDPGNEVAKSAMEFIRTKGKDYSEVQKLKYNGRIKKFYPPLGTNPDFIRNCVFAGIGVFLVLVLSIIFWPREGVRYKGDRGDFSSLALTESQKKNAISTQVSPNTVHYILDEETAVKCQQDAIMYCQENKDNHSQREINRLLNSNASKDIKGNVMILQGELFKDFNFDKLTEDDNFSYTTVANEPVLYKGCYVAWAGKMVNPTENADGSWQCVLMVGLGYQDDIHKDGDVDVYFKPEYRKPINPSRPIKILGVVTERGGKLVLEGRSVYQPVKGSF